MPLPEYLADALQRETEKFDRSQLAKSARELTDRYKSASISLAGPAIASDAERAAYLAVRFPATFAVNEHVFRELRRLAPEAAIASLLDLGAGPGTSFLAATEIFPELKKATLLERDQRWLDLGKRLMSAIPHHGERDTEWLRTDLRSGLSAQSHDVVIISYALGELSATDSEITLRQAWNFASQFLVIIEPGTPPGFGVVNRARTSLINAGAHLLAPCPHSDACPMAAAGDWCHFSQRLQRTAEHRQLKGGSLGYEDEKFSYLIASREALNPAAARIVRHPRKHTGFLHLDLCTSTGLQVRTVTKSQKTAYKQARHAEWGDAWDMY
jgi:ribosomal protein RSM22 (predicted rRNA methylase)